MNGYLSMSYCTPLRSFWGWCKMKPCLDCYKWGDWVSHFPKVPGGKEVERDTSRVSLLVFRLKPVTIPWSCLTWKIRERGLGPEPLEFTSPRETKATPGTGRNTKEGLGRQQVVAKWKSHCHRFECKAVQVLCCFCECVCLCAGRRKPLWGWGWVGRWVRPEQRAAQPFSFNTVSDVKLIISGPGARQKPSVHSFWRQPERWPRFPPLDLGQLFLESHRCKFQDVLDGHLHFCIWSQWQYFKP